MTKLDLQKELLEKVKPGMKPSDIKKQRKENSPNVSEKPVIKPSPSPIKTEPEPDLGYESEEEKSTITIPTAPPLPNEQIKALQRQLQVYKDFREADLKIKEQYKQEIKEWKQKYSELEKQAKNTIKTPIKETQDQATQTEPSYFYCDICQLTKQGTYLIRKVDSPFEPRTHQKLCYACSSCRKYTKELNETNWKEQDNPYKLYD